MTTKKLLMFAVAGLLSPLAYDSVATAEVHNSVTTVALPAPTRDLAPTTGTPARLKRNDRGQAGHEQAAFAMFGDGKSGFLIAMSTELNGVRATNRVQLSLTPFTLTQDAGTGAVSAVANTAAAKFVTNNNGSENRNSNNPSAMTVNGGNVICAKYNINQNGQTDRYIQCFNQAGVTVLKQVKAYAKNNDNCAMAQDLDPGAVVSFDKATATTKIVEWTGCDGAGQDDGYGVVSTVKCNSADLPTTCTFTNVFDVSLCQAEGRSHGKCSVAAADTSFAVCSWTEGDTQPQRKGTWLGAFDLSTNAKGANQQQTVLWKKQIGGRIDLPDGRRSYAQRAMHERIMVLNPATNQLEPTDQLMFRHGDAVGTNNNNGKGGTYITQKLAVMKVSRTGMTYIAQPTDYSADLIGTGGTHLIPAGALFGTTDKPMPGFAFIEGSFTGGGPSAQLRSIGYDAATAKFVNLGVQPVGSYDAHLYPNYEGNNPGNQGRNYGHAAMVNNPYVGQAGNTDAYLLVSATTGKTMNDVMNPAIKLTGLLTVTGIAQVPHTGGGTGSGSGSGSDPGPDDPGSDPGTTLSGCSAGGTSTGLAAFLLVGLAAFLRRRR